MKCLDKDSGGVSPKIQFRLRRDSLEFLMEIVEEANKRARSGGQEAPITMSGLCRMWVEKGIAEAKGVPEAKPLQEAPNVLAAIEKLRGAGK